MTPPSPRTHPLGDSAVTIYLGTDPTPALLDRVHRTARALRDRHFKNVLDVVPSYLGVTVFYDPRRATYREMEARLLEACDSAAATPTANEASRTHLIEVLYDGLDLATVAERTGMSVDQVVQLHSEQHYRVDLIGFVPGFAYLSRVTEALQLPRRDQPRPRVPAGSVAIAGAQTGVYPLDTPGGWHILGRTSTVMFDARRDEPALLRPGDTVKFQPV
jgi:inhibitor of KinA